MFCATPHVDRKRRATQLAQSQIGTRRRPNVRSSRRSQHVTRAVAGITIATAIAHMVIGTIMSITKSARDSMAWPKK